MEKHKELMDSIWESRNSGADTEEKLVAEILILSLSYTKEEIIEMAQALGEGWIFLRQLSKKTLAKK